MRRVLGIGLCAALLALGFLFGQEDPPSPSPSPTESPLPTESPSPSPTESPSPSPTESPSPPPSPTPEPTESVKPAPVKPDAYALYKSKNYREAVAVCLEEIRQAPAGRDPYVIAAWSYIALGEYEEAYDISRIGIERTGSDARLTDNIEESLVKAYGAFSAAGKYNEALAKIQKLIAVLPSSREIPAAYAAMGEIYLNKGNYIFADIAFSVALYSNPNIFEWWVGAGNAREKANDFRSALAAFNEALKIEPDSEEAKRGRDRVRQKISP